MKLHTIWKRILRNLKLLSLACVALAFAAPATYAQGKSGNTPAAERSNGKVGSTVPAGKGGDSFRLGGKVRRPNTAPVPEPATWATMASLAALAALLIARQRKLPASS